MLFKADLLKYIKCASAAAGICAACWLYAAEPAAAPAPAPAAAPAPAPAPVVLPPDYDSAAVAEYISLADKGDGPGLAGLYERYTSAGKIDDFAVLILAGSELRTGSPRSAADKLLELTKSKPLPGASEQHHALYARTLWELANACLLVNDFSRARESFEYLAAMPVDEEWRASARGGSIYAAIQGGEFSRAGKLLESTDEIRGRDELRTWLLFRTGSGEFSKSYSGLCKAEAVPADLADIRKEIAMAAGSQQEDTAGIAAALPYWRDAFVLETDTAKRMVLGRKVIDGHAASGNTDAALQTASRYMELFPEDPERGTLMLLMARLAAESDTEKALRIYRNAGEDASIDIASRRAAFTECALLQEKTGRYSESLVSTYALAEIADDSESRQDAALLTAGIHERAGNSHDALKYFRNAAACNASAFCEASTGTARNAVAEKEWQTAFDAASAVIGAEDQKASQPFLAEAYFRKGEALAGMGRAEESLGAFLHTSVEHSASSFGIEAAGRAGDINASLGRYEEALKNYDFAANLAQLESFEESAVFIVSMRMKAIDSAGRAMAHAAVKEQIEALYKTAPDSEMLLPAVIWYGDLLKSLGRKEDAVREYVLWEERFAGQELKLARLYLEEALAASDDQEGRLFALEKLEKVLEIKTEADMRLNALFEKADVLNRSGDYQNARDTCLEAITLISENPDPREQQLLAMLVMRLGDNSFQIFQLLDDQKMLEESITAYSNVISSEFLPASFRPQAAFRLGKCYEESPTPGKALRIYEEVLAHALLEHAASGRITGRSWVLLSGNAGIALCLRQSSSEIGVRALELLEAMKKLGLPAESDYDSLALKIRSEFAL